MKIIRDTEALEELTPETLGRLLANMKSDQQAAVFNAMAVEAATWPGNAQMQWVYVAESMTESAKEILEDIIYFTRTSDGKSTV